MNLVELGPITETDATLMFALAIAVLALGAALMALVAVRNANHRLRRLEQARFIDRSRRKADRLSKLPLPAEALAEAISGKETVH